MQCNKYTNCTKVLTLLFCEKNLVHFLHPFRHPVEKTEMMKKQACRHDILLFQIIMLLAGFVIELWIPGWEKSWKLLLWIYYVYFALCKCNKIISAISYCCKCKIPLFLKRGCSMKVPRSPVPIFPSQWWSGKYIWPL